MLRSIDASPHISVKIMLNSKYFIGNFGVKEKTLTFVLLLEQSNNTFSFS